MKRKLKFCGCTPNYSNLKQEVKLELSYKSISDVPNSLKYQIPLKKIIEKGNIKLTWVCLVCKNEINIKDTFKEVRFDEDSESIIIDDSL